MLTQECLDSEGQHPLRSISSSLSTWSHDVAAYFEGESLVDHAMSIVQRRSLQASEAIVTYTPQQTRAIQIVATTMASLSIAAAIIALYWFCLMRRNYRRDLVLLLVLSDLLKNFCYVLFAGVNFGISPVQSGDRFCEASGYLLQTGLEACDFAIFFISLHMFLQIFPRPSTIFGYDGLYNVRYWVYALWFILPNITAALAFINGSGAYAVQGTWCWLPVRPFWYRLALAWVPRYIIATLIMSFAIAIYVHVGAEFKLFGKEHGSSPSAEYTSPIASGLNFTTDTTGVRTNRTGSLQGSVVPAIQRSLQVDASEGDPFARNMFVSPQIGTAFPNSRRHSFPTWTSPFDASGAVEAGHVHGTHSEAVSRRGSRQVTFESVLDPYDARSPLAPLEEAVPSYMRPSVISSVSSNFPSTKESFDDRSTIPAAPIIDSTLPSLAPGGEVALKARNNAIRRQVRGLFAYPIAYIVFWIMPFVFHCMNYSDRFAVRPLFPVALLSSLSITSLGFVDVVIFCWRERPWRHIPASDGTFGGSFCFWQFKTLSSQVHRQSVASNIAAAEGKAGAKRRPSGVIGSFKKLFGVGMPSSQAGTYRYSGGGSDRKVRENEGAQERLQMEMRDIHAATVARSQSVGEAEASNIQIFGPASEQRTPGSKNWFDRGSIVGLDDV